MNLHKMGKGRDHDITQSHFVFRNISSVKRDDVPDQVVDNVLFLEDFSNQFQSPIKECNNLTVKLQSRRSGACNLSSSMIGDSSQKNYRIGQMNYTLMTFPTLGTHMLLINCVMGVDLY